MEQFISKLGLPFKLERIDDKTYSTFLGDSNEWDKIYIILSNKDFLVLDEDRSTNSLFESFVVWTSDGGKYTVVDKADFEKDEYVLSVMEN